MLPFYTLLILCAISGVLLALAVFAPPGRLWSALSLLWLAGALPALFFLGMDWRHVLLFYLISGGLGLLFLMGGKRS